LCGRMRSNCARAIASAGGGIVASISILNAAPLPKILADRPDWVDARVQLGLTRYLAGDTSEARTIWQACQSQRPDLEGIAAYLAMVERIPG